jgi:CheY-like chemotaxis protein
MQPPKPSASEPAAHILVAEDNPAVREFIVRSLNSAGYTVTAAIDGQAALDALTREKFHVLVTDIVMPNVDGIALAMKAIRVFAYRHDFGLCARTHAGP